MKIETGRFSKPLTPLENKLCDYCSSEIEDEFHFLIQCPKYLHIRNSFYLPVQNHCKNLLLLDDKLKFNRLLTKSDENVILELANFIFEGFLIHGN